MIALGLAFFLEFFRDSDIAASVILGIIRYFGSTSNTTQPLLFFWL